MVKKGRCGSSLAEIVLIDELCRRSLGLLRRSTQSRFVRIFVSRLSKDMQGYPTLTLADVANIH